MTPAVARVPDLLFHWARETPEALALSDISSERRYTFAEAASKVLALAEALGPCGAAPGQRVALVGENGPTFALCYLACLLRGAWPVLVNARLSRAEIEAIFLHARPRLALFTTGDSPEARVHAASWGASRAAAGSPFEDLGLEASAPFPDASPEVDAEAGAEAKEDVASATPGKAFGARARRQDVAALIYTSGTTGTPKGVLLSHENLLFVARTSAELRQLQASDRVCGLLPVSHVYGLSSVLLATLQAGASLHFLPRFHVPTFCETLRTHALTVLQTVPAVYFKLLSHFRETETPALPSLRYLHCGGSPLDPQLKADVERTFGLPLHHGYGLTETSPTLAQTRRTSPRTDCSVGQPVPGVEVRIHADGELWVRGPGVMLGYYNDPERTREVLSADGWFRTGDLASQGDDGALHILGRKKDLIVRSGFNVYPAEVEAVLLSHPHVSGAAVVGVAEACNETVVAFVVPAPSSSVLDAEGLKAYLAARLAPYKKPSHVFLVDTLPLTSSGKVRKHELVASARARMGLPAPNP